MSKKFSLFPLLVVVCLVSFSVRRAAAVCQVQVVSSIAPSDGGSATPPALITPSSIGTPANMSNAGTSEPASDVLVFDDGALPNCFSTNQTLQLQYSLAMTSPTVAAFNAGSPNFTVYDSLGSNGLVVAQPTASSSFGANQGPLTIITFSVLRPGTSGNPTIGPAGAAIRLRNLKFNSAGLAAGALVTVSVSTSVAGTFTPAAFTVGTAVLLGPLTISATSLNFQPQLIGSTSAATPLLVTNTGALPISFAPAQISGDFSQSNNCGTSLAGHTSCVVSAFFSPIAIGARAGSLTINDNAPGNPHIIALSGTGTVQGGPAIASLSPDHSFAGAAGLALVVNGSNFVSGSTVLWSGSARATTFVSSTQIIAAITPADLATVGLANISVSNFGGGISAAASFAIRPSPMPAGARVTIVPHVVSGGGYVTRVTVVNLTNAANSGTFNFISQSGNVLQATPFNLSPAGTARFSTPEEQRFGTPVIGWAAVGTTGAVGVNLFFEFEDANGNVVNSIGFNNAQPLTDVTFPLAFDNIAGGPVLRTGGLALANATTAVNPIQLQLFDEDGSLRAVENRTLPAFGQISIDLSTVPAFAPVFALYKSVHGGVAVKSTYPLEAIALQSTQGNFAAVPAITGRSTMLADDVAAVCPAAAEIDRFNADLNITFESDVSAPGFVCHAVEGSRDLTRSQQKAYQALRAMKQLEVEAPLPWTQKALYDWLVSTAAGLRFRGDINASSCCSPAATPSISLTASNPALLNNGWLGPFNLGSTSALDALPQDIVQQTRQIETGPHSCGAFDLTISELGGWGAQFYLEEWEARYSGFFLLDSAAPAEPAGRYALTAAADARGLISAGDFCTPQPALAAPTAVSFGTLPVGNLGPYRTVVVTAGTSTPLHVTGVSFTGANASEFQLAQDNCTNQDVPSTCALVIAFNPAVASARSANVVISYTGVAGSPITVPLSGTGALASVLPSMPHVYALPQIASGGGYITRIAVTNLTSVDNPGVINYFSPGGTLLQSQQFALAPGGTLHIASPESDRFGASSVKWAVVGSLHPVGINLAFEVKATAGGAVTNTVGFNDAQPVSSFTIPVEFQPGTPAAPVGRTVGLAMATMSASGSNVTMKLLDSGGHVLNTASVNLPPFGQTSIDLKTIPQIVNVLPPGNFQGSLQVTATQPVAAIALQDDLGPFSALPVMPGTAQ